MAKNISLLGADYPDVPAVVLPKTGGGSATFVDEDYIGLQYKKINLANGVTQTFELPADETIFAIVVTRTNVSSTSAEGILIGGAGATNSHITAIGNAPSNMEYSISGRTISLKSSTSNLRAILVYA